MLISVFKLKFIYLSIYFFKIMNFIVIIHLLIHCSSSPLCPGSAQSLSIVRELTDVEVSAPDEACFECEVSAPVSISPVWTLNGEPLQSSSQVLLEKMGTVHRMTLRQTSTDMAGEVEFTCGKAKSKAQLRVLSE